LQAQRNIYRSEQNLNFTLKLTLILAVLAQPAAPSRLGEGGGDGDGGGGLGEGGGGDGDVGGGVSDGSGGEGEGGGGLGEGGGGGGEGEGGGGEGETMEPWLSF